ncbi:LacI family DNA-binding transcriptional regulator [Microbacterium sp. R86528]|uniref:LacI family DNA-binding transcriptional regulator n=1 Tax=Microbacterium sp. R86528 TaxID=3093864 RepID=UPI0037C66699
MSDDSDAEPQRSVPTRRRSSGGAPTIYDIAELTGVNPSTVSRALGKPGRVSAKTEAKIRAAAAQLNFRVNPMARALPTGRTHTLALIVADITNPLFFRLVRGAELAATGAGYALVIAESQESGDAEADVIEQIMPSVDGIVLATTRLSPERIAEIASRKPLVVVNREVVGVTAVVPGVERGTQALVSHLYEMGHRSIAYLSGPVTSWMSERRWTIILEAAEALGIAAVEIGPASPTLSGGREALRRVIASRATAVVAFNDLMAMGLMQAAAEAAVVVPDELSVAGFDDIFGSELISPALTTVRAPLVEMGQRAVVGVLAAVSSEDDAVSEDMPALTTELIVRGSTGHAPGGPFSS